MPVPTGTRLGLRHLWESARDLTAASTTVMKPAVRDVDPVTIQAARLPMAALALWVTPWARGTGRRVQAHLREAGLLLLALGALTGLSAKLFITGLKYAG